MRVLDPSGGLVGTWMLSDPSDIIGTTVGGPRYGWFPIQSLDVLAIDDAARS